MRVSQDKASPAFPRPLSLLTGLLLALWIIASLANPAAWTLLLASIMPLLFISVMLILVGALFPFARPLSRAILKGLGLLFGITVVGGYALFRGAQKSRAGGRGEPRDLLIEVLETKASSKCMVRFVRAGADIGIPTGACVTAEGKVRGSTLVAERLEIDTGLGRIEARSAGGAGRVFGYAWLAITALLAASAVSALL